MEVQIEGRPKDNIVQWLLSVHEPENTSRNAAALAEEALLKPRPKPPKPAPAPKQHKLKKPSQTNATEKPAPKSSSDDLLLLSDSDLLPTPTPKRPTKTVRTPGDEKKVAERFERRARHKTREDKYEPKKEKEKKKRERRVTERQSKTKTKERRSKSEQHEHATDGAKKRSKAQGRPLKRLSSAIEENFKARNVSQERLTVR
ncbi:hypothetical protein KEM55_003879 [Ascosphaera atra]|nr:hypothetical protein KEM55_003879 [Ascosphaera atra]